MYPVKLETPPEIPSPLTSEDGSELVVTCTADGRYGIVPVTLKPSDRQCDADVVDFPRLASTGLHSAAELDRTRSIIGRPVEEITEPGQPGRLSTDGFLGAGEDILSALKADNRRIAAGDPGNHINVLIIVLRMGFREWQATSWHYNAPEVNGLVASRGSLHAGRESVASPHF